MATKRTGFFALMRAQVLAESMVREGCSGVELTDFAEDAYGDEPTLDAAFLMAAETAMQACSSDRAQRPAMRRAR